MNHWHPLTYATPPPAHPLRQAYVSVAERIWEKLQAGDAQQAGLHAAPKITFE